MSKKNSKKATETKPETVQNKPVEAVKSTDAPQVSTEVKEPVKNVEKPATGQDDAIERNDSIQSHSAQVTEGEAAQARSEGVDLKSHPLDSHDGAQLDATNGEPEFDVAKEKKLAHAKPEEPSDAVKNAIVNPNGVGNEWPR